jgi:hypothetical protein
VKNKTIKFWLLSICTFSFLSQNIFCQSDYQITQVFKSKYDSLNSIADTIQVLENILNLEESVNNFKKEYLPHKGLIDKASYPITFDTMFNDIENKLSNALIAAQRVRSLSTEVLSLSQEKVILSKRVEILLDEIAKQNDYLNNLIQRNSRLSAELKELRANPPEDKRAKDSLRILVGKLKNNIIERDDLVKSMLDSLFQSTRHRVSSLSEVERMNLASNIESIEIIENVKKLILDNIEFLEELELEQMDISELKGEYYKFQSTWEKIGKNIALVYSGKKKYRDELAEINILIFEWGATIDLVIWNEVVSLFHSKKINIESFSSAEDFENSLTDYIDGQIRLIENESEILHYNSYNYFKDIWDEDFIPTWYPFLIENNLLTETEKENVEIKIENWQKIVKESSPWWIYIIVILVLLVIIVVVWNFLNKRSKYKNSEEKENSSVTTE